MSYTLTELRTAIQDYTENDETTFFGLFRRNSDLDEETLKKIAEMTNAQYFRASDTKTLRAVYEAIDQLEPSTAEMTVFVRHEEQFALFLQLAMVLLVMQLILEETWLRVLP